MDPHDRPASANLRHDAADGRRPVRRRQWPYALIFSIGLHGAVVGAMLVDWRWARHADDSPPPAAMVVELAVMPASPPIPATQVAPGPEQVEAQPGPKPVEQKSFDPPPQVDAALKPSFILPVKPEQKPIEAPTVAREARETTAPQAVEAAAVDKTAAPVEGNNAAPPSNAEQAWEGKILAKLERNKRYPSAAQAGGQQDTVLVRLVIDRAGRLIEASLKKSAGFALLDNATLELARRASPFPAPPPGVTGDRIVRVVPVEFYIRKRR